MAYRFRRSDVSLEAGLGRIALEQVRKAIAEIDDAAISPDETVHQMRRRSKKLRALLKLVRPAFDGYKAENAFLRDAAAELSTARDAAVLVSAYDGLVPLVGEQADTREDDNIRTGLLLHQQHTASDGLLRARLSGFRDAMAVAAERIAAWTLGEDDFDAVAGGLEKTYGDARRAMARAREQCSPANLHEWRKRAKDHWYHTRLLRKIRPSAMKPHRKNALKLSELLGEYHDLAVLEAWLLNDSERFSSTEALVPLIGRIEQRRTALENESFALGEQLFRARPETLCREWRHYWEKWQSE